MEGVVLDLWKPGKSRLPLRRDRVAQITRCGRSFHEYNSGSCHQDSIAQSGTAFLHNLCNLDVTVSDVFESTERDQGAGNLILAFDGGIVPFQAAVLASKSSQSEAVRLSNARTASKINCMSKAFGNYAQQAGPAWHQTVTRAGATVEVLCHAHF